MNFEKLKGDRNKKNLRLTVILILLAVITVGCVDLLSVKYFERATKYVRSETITKTTKLTAELIDADKINYWLENGADEDYKATRNTLQHVINNTPSLQYLYVYQITEEGCHVIFDLETEDESLEQYDENPDISTSVLGSVENLDEDFQKYMPKLLAGEELDVLETHGRYGWLMTKYQPIFDSSGKCVAYAGADIAMRGIYYYRNLFMFLMVGVSSVFLAIFILISNRLIVQNRKDIIYDEFIKQQKHDEKLLREVIEAFAQVIDAKDRYTQGHSTRVAEYSERIAKLVGKNEDECREIYYTALLHDVGKVGIPLGIINKNGKLTDEEYELVKQHPLKGNNILSSINEFPYLSIGAHYHHERYDGRGYPEKLKGDDIPEIARIIAVADAYDAMTSNRSYRAAIPQDLVREEIVKGSGTQFDPKFAKAMQHLIDLDSEYEMKEREAVSELAGKNELVVGDYRSEYSEGILLTQCMTTICITVNPDEPSHTPVPSLVLFDSLDGRVHDDDEKEAKELLYFEYGEIWLDGKTATKGARKMQVSYSNDGMDIINENEFRIQAVKVRDHVLVNILSRKRKIEITTALPDSTRYAYLVLTGEHCRLTSVSVVKTEEQVSNDYIKRIAEEVSFINVPAGDIPNLQVDGFRSAATDGISIPEKMVISFHTMSLPTARLVWHCPYMVVFSSDDGQINGVNYKEYALIRLDGENWESDSDAKNDLIVNVQDSFSGWEAWKEYNKAGYDTSVSFEKSGNTITVTTSNLGLYIKNVTTVPDGIENVYVALTGDQCAITNIRINRED
ncbi:MAG: HD-GYP domain-containing protein [Oscillospiraceae bacterium]|nr:HD-GYP domain-containing protein [Oscillospiraceae bacterium]